jgi:hypothetical protein
MDPPRSARLRGRAVHKSTRQTQGRSKLKFPSTSVTIPGRSGPALNRDQNQQQQNAFAAAELPDEYDADGEYAEMDHDFNEDPAAAEPNPAASAASVRFRFTAQRQQRTASSNRAALERNWEVLQDPEPWIASLQDRAAVTATLSKTLEDIVTRRWV